MKKQETYDLSRGSLRRLFCLIFLFVSIVAFLSCDDQMNGMMQPVVEEMIETEMAEMPAEMMAEIDYADLPFIESTDLEPGLYRMSVSGHGTSNGRLTLISASTLEEGVRVRVNLHPNLPISYSTAFQNTEDEVVVRIYAKGSVEETDEHLQHILGYTSIQNYYGSLIKILKHPEKDVVDYAYQPTGYEDLPVLRVAFQDGEIQPGQYLMFSEGRRTEGSKLVSIYSEIPEEEVRLRVLFDPGPWSVTADDETIRYTGVVVEITESLGVNMEMVGRKEITYHDFQGILLKNFSNPDIPVEYEN